MIDLISQISKKASTNHYNLQKLFEDNKINESNIVKVLSQALSINRTATIDEINKYINQEEGTIRICPTEIRLNGFPIKQSDIQNAIAADIKATARLKSLTTMFEMGNTPCRMSTQAMSMSSSQKQGTCKYDGRICYLKIRLGEKHKSTCVYCYDCLRGIGLININAFLAKIDPSKLFICACKEPINMELIMMCISKQISDIYMLADKKLSNNDLSIFCKACGKLQKVGKGTLHTNFKCEKCTTPSG